MVSGTVGENSRWALGFHGKSRVAARVFLMAGQRDIHFEQRRDVFPQFLSPWIFFFFQILDPAEGNLHLAPFNK